MATIYQLKKVGPTARQFFQEILGTFPQESYPNGNSGSQDFLSWVFQVAGYSRVSGHGGNAATTAMATFRHGGQVNRKEAAKRIIAHTPFWRYDSDLPERTRKFLEGI